MNREIKFRVWDIENKEMLDLEEKRRKGNVEPNR